MEKKKPQLKKAYEILGKLNSKPTTAKSPEVAIQTKAPTTTAPITSVTSTATTTPKVEKSAEVPPSKPPPPPGPPPSIIKSEGVPTPPPSITKSEGVPSSKPTPPPGPPPHFRGINQMKQKRAEIMKQLEAKDAVSANSASKKTEPTADAGKKGREKKYHHLTFEGLSKHRSRFLLLVSPHLLQARLQLRADLQCLQLLHVIEKRLLHKRK